MNRRQRRAAGKSGGSARRPSSASRAALLDGVALHRAGRLDEAERRYRDALRLDPADPDALNLLGTIAHQRGRHADACRLIGKAIAIDGANALYHNNLALALRADGKGARAVSHAAEAVRLAPRDADARVNLGNALMELGRREEAARAYRDALDLSPDDFNAHAALGRTLGELGQGKEAEPHLRRAVELDPGSADAAANLGKFLADSGRPEEAEPHVRRAVDIDPGHFEALLCLAQLLRNRLRPDQAEGYALRAVEVAPGEARGHTVLGDVRKELGAHEGAEASLRRALDLSPGFPEAWHGLGDILFATGRWQEADDAYGEALASDPGYRKARVNRGYTRLVQGRLAAGWEDHRHRPRPPATDDTRPEAPLGRDLAEQRILLLREQGLGDELFYLRFAALLKARGARVAYFPDPKIASLVARLPSVDRLTDDPDEAADHRHLVGDLPYLLGCESVADIPPPVRIPPLPELAAEARERLSAAGPPPYIGVTWRAGTQRWSTLSKIVPMAAVAGALRPLLGTVVAVQRAPHAGELEDFSRALGRTAADFTGLNDDLEAMLALLSLLDDYVCVSNTNLHLRVAADKTCRVLVPFPPEYRWMTEDAGSPWYPGCRVYRETPDGGWDDALAALAHGLSADFG